MGLNEWLKAKKKSMAENRTDFSTLLEPIQKSSIRIIYDENFSGELPAGSSKLGGKPDLPSDFQWYYYKGKSYEEEIAGLPPGILKYYNPDDAKYTTALPLSFIAQINLEEVHKYDKDNLLPPKGILYFFYELENMPWGDIHSKGGAKVYYFSGNVSELQRTDYPADLKDEYKLPEMPMAFSTKNELPDFEEFMQWYFDKFEWTQTDSYDNAKVKMGFESQFGNEEQEMSKMNKLLGYANLIQGGMLMECEAGSRNIEIYPRKGGNSEKLTKNELQQLKDNCTKWQLLFQLESIQLKDYEMLWGDAGRIYFYINTDDLVKCNFDNCWLILQCY